VIISIFTNIFRKATNTSNESASYNERDDRGAAHTQLYLHFQVYKPVSDSVTVATISIGPGIDKSMCSECPSEKSITFFISSSLKEKFVDPFICFV
jgi:hypothetical protein